jgi:hypothetical protein
VHRRAPTLLCAPILPPARHGRTSMTILFERRFGDLIKWSFVFWVGAVGAIAMLARALR